VELVNGTIEILRFGPVFILYGRRYERTIKNEIGKKYLLVRNEILLFGVKDYRNLRPSLLRHGNQIIIMIFYMFMDNFNCIVCIYIALATSICRNPPIHSSTGH
jgi:hypothetical protein